MAATIPDPVLAAQPHRFGHLETFIRPLRAGDEEVLRAFFASHTPDTVYARYGCQLTEMTPQQASALVCVNPAHDCALGIFVAGADGRDSLCAIGRYVGDPDGHGAEAAFVVHEKTRRLGMATKLLQLLTERATRNGMSRLFAHIQVGNDEMIGVFERQGFKFRTDVFSGIVIATRSLVDGAEP